MTTQYLFPTPLSWLARKLFKKFRQLNHGNDSGEKSAVMGALLWYHRLPQGNPELAEICRPLVERY